MRVKLQLVMCNDEGHEETVTDVITLNKNNQRIEHLQIPPDLVVKSQPIDIVDIVFTAHQVSKRRPQGMSQQEIKG